MVMVKFKFDVGDKVYLTHELEPYVAHEAKCYTISSLVHEEVGNKYLLTEGHDGWILEENLVAARYAQDRAILNCNRLLREIAALEFEA